MPVIHIIRFSGSVTTDGKNKKLALDLKFPFRNGGIPCIKNGAVGGQPVPSWFWQQGMQS